MMGHLGGTIQRLGRVRVLPVAALAALCLLASKGLDFVAEGEVASLARLTAVANAQNATADEPVGEGAEASQTEGGQIISLEDSAESEVTSERAVLERLSERRQMLDRREESLNLRERLLEAAENQLQDRLSELRAIEERIITAVEEKEKEDAQRLQDLVTMYENMKPKEAARIFNTLNLDIMVSVVRQMNARKMGEILAKMAPERAQMLTIELARPPAPVGSDLPNTSALPKIGDDT